VKYHVLNLKVTEIGLSLGFRKYSKYLKTLIREKIWSKREQKYS
jgi:hypothetical protein